MLRLRAGIGDAVGDWRGIIGAVPRVGTTCATVFCAWGKPALARRSASSAVDDRPHAVVTAAENIRLPIPHSVIERRWRAAGAR